MLRHFHHFPSNQIIVGDDLQWQRKGAFSDGVCINNICLWCQQRTFFSSFSGLMWLTVTVSQNTQSDIRLKSKTVYGSLTMPDLHPFHLHRSKLCFPSAGLKHSSWSNKIPSFFISPALPNDTKQSFEEFSAQLGAHTAVRLMMTDEFLIPPDTEVTAASRNTAGPFFSFWQCWLCSAHPFGKLV